MELPLNKIDIFITKLKKLISNKDIIVILQGDLASGKTTLVKAYVKSCGINQNVTSPTFMIQSVYGDSIYHYDIYNKNLESFISTGLLEEFEKEGVHFVEWGNNKLIDILKEYGFEYIVVKIKKKDESREYIIES